MGQRRPGDARGQAAGRGRADQDEGEQRAQAEQGPERQDEGAADEHGYDMLTGDSVPGGGVKAGMAAVW